MSPGFLAAAWIFRFDASLPYLVITKSDAVSPPDVFLAVPLATIRLEPVILH
jgi:hypothetical protein